MTYFHFVYKQKQRLTVQETMHISQISHQFASNNKQVTRFTLFVTLNKDLQFMKHV